MIYWPAKAPGETLDYEVDFSSELQSGENIASHTIAASGVTPGSDNAADGKVSVTLSGGTLGVPGIVVWTITTDAIPARTYSETAVLPIGEEPLSLSMAKAQCNIDDGEDAWDELFGELIQSAREYVESYTGTKLVPTALEMTFATFADLQRLTQAPVQSITGVTYLDANGALQTLDPATYDEFFNVNADPLRPSIQPAFNVKLPTVRPVPNAVRVNAIVGWTVVPKPLIRAMKLLIGFWFDQRTGVAIDVRGTPTELEHAVTALLANYRI